MGSTIDLKMNVLRFMARDAVALWHVKNLNTLLTEPKIGSDIDTGDRFVLFIYSLLCSMTYPYHLCVFRFGL